MYTLISAIGVERGVNKRWKDIDLSSITIKQMFSTYRQVYVVLTHPAIVGNLTVNVEDIMTDVQAHTGTFSNYLSAIGNATLPTVDGVPTIMTNQAAYSDAFAAGFHVDTIDHLAGEGIVLPKELRPDLIVTLEAEPVGYDYVGLRNRVLANVNGFYHYTVADSSGYYVVDGNASAMKANRNCLGMLSFGTMGELEIHRLDVAGIAYETDVVTQNVERVHIRCEGADLTAKVPVLILGGYMLMLDEDQLLITNSNILTFKTHRYPFAERYFESNTHLDFSDFDLKANADNPQEIAYQGFRQRPYLSKLFGMSQTFLVLVDAKNLTTERAYPDRETVPHTYLSYTQPKWPLVVCEGKHEVYWVQEEAGTWMIRCSDTYRYNYMFQTVNGARLVKIDDGLFPGDAGSYSPAYFLKIMEEEIKIRTT